MFLNLGKIKVKCKNSWLEFWERLGWKLFYLLDQNLFKVNFLTISKNFILKMSDHPAYKQILKKCCTIWNFISYLKNWNIFDHRVHFGRWSLQNLVFFFRRKNFNNFINLKKKVAVILLTWGFLITS